jgi:hypothetical protein
MLRPATMPPGPLVRDNAVAPDPACVLHHAALKDPLSFFPTVAENEDWDFIPKSD